MKEMPVWRKRMISSGKMISGTKLLKNDYSLKVL